MKTSEIAEFVGGELDGDGEVEVISAAAITNAKNGEIVFFEKLAEMPGTGASCVLVFTGFTSATADNVCLIRVQNPKLSFARVAAVLHPYAWRTGWHETAIVSTTSEVKASFLGALVSVGEDCQIGESCNIYEGVKIGSGVSVGKCTIIYPNCVLYDGVSVGSNCVIHSGTVIGADGFGYVKDPSGNYHKFPQIGSVVIEDDVEIGANSCIDRGALGITRIGAGTKIDNLVQVGHNVNIGKRCVIAAQTGISGSVTIEDDCVIGGQVGFGDHVRVQSGAVIGSQAGVLPGKIVRPGVWWGTPVQPLDEYKRQNAYVKGIERLKARVKELEKRLGERDPIKPPS